MSHKIITGPNPDEYAPYFQTYIDLVESKNVIQLLEDQLNEALSIYKVLDPSKIDYRYAEGKWNIKEVLLHILDTERIFCYRALRIARKDQTPLPGFEQDDYIKNTEWNEYPFSFLIEEYQLVRKHTILFFNNMSKEMLEHRSQQSIG